MRRPQRVKAAALWFLDFSPAKWFLGFVALLVLSVAWLDFTRPPPIRPSSFLLYSAMEEEDGEDAAEPPRGRGAPLFTAGSRAAPDAGEVKEIGGCLRSVKIDVDGDGRREQVCVRTAAISAPDGRPPREVLVVDLFRHGDWFLRQELDPGLFGEERFHLLRDLDMDGGAELVTRLPAVPGGPGADTYRIYRFDGYAFVETLHVFGLPPQDASVAYFLRHLPEVQADITERYTGETGSEELCGDPGEEGDCFEGPPWLLDSDGDGRLELAQLLEPPGGGSVAKPAPFRLFVKEFRRRGTEGRSRIHGLGPGPRGERSGSIVLHRPEGGPVLVLAAFSAPGDAARLPAAAVFELAGTRLKKTSGIEARTPAELAGRQGLAARDGPADARQAAGGEVEGAARRR